MSEPSSLLGRACAAVVWAITPRCHDVTRLLSRQLDAPLPLRTRLQLRLHLWMCAYCERYAAQLRWLRGFARGFPEATCEHDHAHLSPESRERLRAEVARAAGESSA